MGAPKSVEQGASYSEGYIRYPHGLWLLMPLLPFDKRVGVLGGFAGGEVEGAVGGGAVGGEAVRGDNLKPLTELIE